MSIKAMITSRSFGSISSEPMDALLAAGYEVDHRGKSFDQAAFEADIPDYDALIIGAHPFPREVMARCKKLKIICKHGAGLDNIDLDAARELGIAVCNTPGTNSNAVADLTFALMLGAARNVVRADRKVHEGQWKTFIGRDVYGKTLGLIGFGAISTCVARRAVGFNMKVLVYAHHPKPIPDEFKDYVRQCPLEEVLKNCDYMSLHVPLTDETRHMIGKEELAMMRPGSYLINVARGGVVNEEALYEALVSGHLAGAAMDVCEHEPIQADNPLLKLENVIITPHIGMYSSEAIGSVSQICADNAAAMAKGEALRFRVV